MKVNKFFVYVCVIFGWLLRVWIGEVSDHNLHVYVIDVGQGDAILVRTPAGKNILIDGGGGDYVLVELGQILPPWVRRIDILVLTHPHADHFFGLMDVIERYQVGAVWWNPVYHGMPEYRYFVKLVAELEDEGILVASVSDGDFWTEGGVEVQVLWPSPWRSGDTALSDKEKVWCDEMGILCNSSYDGNVNNDSILVLVEFGEFSILLMGDAEHEVEAELIGRDGDSRLREIDVLKAGHHCSRTASGSDFLEFVSPQVAICSCGEENKFGHPHEETLENFEDLGVRYFRTDIDGTVHIESNGDWWKVLFE